MPEKNGLLPLPVDNLAGGITDFYLGGEINQWQTHDNQYFNDNWDSTTRPGSDLKYEARINATYALRKVVDHDTSILMQSGPKLHYYSGGVETITGPSGNDVFPVGTDTLKAKLDYWNKHTIAASDSYSSIQRVYKNEDSDWTTENLGVPEVIYANCVALANDLKDDFNSHIADAAEHDSADSDNTVVSDDATDLPSLLELTAELLSSYEAHQSDVGTYHSTDDTTNVLESSEAPSTLFQAYERLKDLKAKYNAHDTSSTFHTTGGTHQASEVAEPVLSASGSGNTYLYGFCFTRRYFVEDKEFFEEGRIHLVESASIAAPDSTTVNITKIPTLPSSTTENWNASGMKVRIFRTTNGGANLYYLGEVDHGTTTYADSLADSSLTNREPAYTEGGILDNDLPPPAKFCKVINNTLILAHYKEGTTVYDNRTIRSKPGQLYAVPGDNFKEYEDSITGVGQSDVYPIVFLKNKCYREEGTIDSTGTGSVRSVLISEKVGCISADSIVNTEDGVYFAAKNGFYFTDGRSVKLISTDLHSSYKALSNKDKIKGVFHESQEWVLWSVQTDPDEDENDTLWCAHLKFRTTKGGHPFTTWSGGHDPTNFSACDVAYIDGVLYRADHRGYLFYHDEDIKVDPYVDTSASPSAWYTQTIYFDLRSVAFDFGDPQARKWVPKFNANADNVTTLHVAVATNVDNDGNWRDLKPISDDSRVAWGDRSVPWGSPLRWNYAAVISQVRYFPAVNGGRIRCMYRQVRFTNDYITIDDSASTGVATIDATAKTITLDDNTKSWVSDPVNYYISFETDDYEAEYKVSALSDLEITVDDPNAALVDESGVAWRLKGYKKNETFRLLNYVLNYKPATQSQGPYRKAQES